MRFSSILRRYAVILPFALLSACSFHLASRESNDGSALHARLLADGPRDPFFTLFVNRPAHVALFDVRPGRSVEMLYPWHAGAGTRVHAGYRAVHPSPFRTHVPVLRAVDDRINVGYLVLVASERPLDLASLRGQASIAGMPAVPDLWFIHGSAFRVMDRLVSHLVTGPSESWTVDHVAYWLTPPPRVFFASRGLWPARYSPPCYRERVIAGQALTSPPCYRERVIAARSRNEPPRPRRPMPPEEPEPPDVPVDDGEKRPPDQPIPVGPPHDPRAPEPERLTEIKVRTLAPDEPRSAVEPPRRSGAERDRDEPSGHPSVVPRRLELSRRSEPPPGYAPPARATPRALPATESRAEGLDDGGSKRQPQL